MLSRHQAQKQGFKTGNVVTGVVRSLKPYGAFVDLGAITALLHISQVTGERLRSVEQVFKVRQFISPSACSFVTLLCVRACVYKSKHMRDQIRHQLGWLSARLSHFTQP